MRAAAEWRVDVGNGSMISALFEPSIAREEGHGDTLFVFAHGAGGHMADRGMVRASQVLRSRGFDVVRFNFPYREKKSGRPDAMPVLKACVSAVVARARAELAAPPQRLVIGGRSMGGRAASMLAADGFDCDGLLLLAYPLHPAGRPDQLRDAHLPSIDMPVLCLNGTRDALCRRDLMEATLLLVKPTWTMHWLEGADHSFHVLKSSGRTDEEVMDEVGRASASWAALAVRGRGGSH